MVLNILEEKNPKITIGWSFEEINYFTLNRLINNQMKNYIYTGGYNNTISKKIIIKYTKQHIKLETFTIVYEVDVEFFIVNDETLDKIHIHLDFLIQIQIQRIKNNFIKRPVRKYIVE